MPRNDRAAVPWPGDAAGQGPSPVSRARIVNRDFYSVGFRADDRFPRYVEDATRAHPHLKNTFVFTGPISDRSTLYEMYRRSRITCLTSRAESFGFVLLEGMYFGNMIVSSDLPSSRDLTQNGTLGLLYPIGDARKLAEALTAVMTDKLDWPTLGWKAHKRVVSHFSWKAIVSDLERILLG